MRVVIGYTRAIEGENGRIGPVRSRSCTTSCNVFVDSLVTRFGHRETVACGVKSTVIRVESDHVRVNSA